MRRSIDHNSDVVGIICDAIHELEGCIKANGLLQHGAQLLASLYYYVPWCKLHAGLSTGIHFNERPKQCHLARHWWQRVALGSRLCQEGSQVALQALQEVGVLAGQKKQAGGVQWDPAVVR